jgi:poly(3-hydroxybutyrate) depolymerase
VNDSPKPTEQCSISKDGNGFFVRTSAKSKYVAYVPKAYTGNEPMRVVVGLHGCSDTAMNFATWGVNPWDTRAAQQHIGISVDGATGNNSCWSKGYDDDKILAAVDDLAKCFWLDRSKVTLAGYSSGGEIAYKVALEHADKFDGLLIEDSGLSSNANPAELLANAAWKLPIAHITHQDDGVFPLSQVESDWAETTKAGFPITTSVVAGTHSGTSADWNTFLLPKILGWQH